ncbi:hypothetical protein GCM10027290_47790 [Micromonospora sonneratiae]|uniref:Uncharacterized protein n=1 Tax=Micromonospora sonneratiae TaxID=1184706 RepID=A0ABW3YD32_9ACTN
MAKRSGQWARQLLVWFHVVTSVGWMSLALTLCALMLWDEPAAYDAALMLDKELLQHLGTSSAFSGLMLAALTSFGYFRYWWVFVKLAITLIQLNLGIFLLSPNLDTATPGKSGALAIGSALMASAIAFQAWLSVAKPWRQTPWTDPRAKPRQFPTWLYLAGIAVPVFDYTFWPFVFGAPAPIASLLIAIGFPFWRRARLRQGRETPGRRAAQDNQTSVRAG